MIIPPPLPETSHSRQTAVARTLQMFRKNAANLPGSGVVEVPNCVKVVRKVLDSVIGASEEVQPGLLLRNLI